MYKCFAVLLTALTILAVDAAAQTPTTTPPARQLAPAAGLDQPIAVCLALGNQQEVAVAEFAKDRAQNPRVKQFAEKMIEQHQQALAKLRQAAPQIAGLNLELQADQPGTQPGAAATPGATPGAPRAAGAAGGNDQMVALQRQIAQECLTLTKTELSEKQGAEFDKCYMGQQVGAHIGMLANLKASGQFASNQLRPVIQEGTTMTQQHLTEAKAIAKELEAGEAARRTAAKPAVE